MKKAPAEEKIPVGEAKEVPASEAAVKPPDTSALDKVIEANPDSPVAEVAKKVKAKKIKAAEAEAKAAEQRSEPADMPREAGTPGDGDRTAALPAHADRPDPPKKIPVGEVKEG